MDELLIARLVTCSRFLDIEIDTKGPGFNAPSANLSDSALIRYLLPQQRELPVAEDELATRKSVEEVLLLLWW